MQTSLKRNMIVLALSRCQFAANYPLMSPLQNGIPGNVYEFADRIIPLPSCLRLPSCPRPSVMPTPSVMPASFRHACALPSCPRPSVMPAPFRHARALPSCLRPSVIPAPSVMPASFCHARPLSSFPPPFVIPAKAGIQVGFSRKGHGSEKRPSRRREPPPIPFTVTSRVCEGRISEEGMRVGRAEQGTRFGTESATRYKDDREREFYKGFFIRGTRFLGRGRSLHGLTKR